MVEYKVVELSVVSDENIEKTLNEYTSQGWAFDQICFAMRDASKRPAMAFIFFTMKKDRENTGGENDHS